MNPTLGLAELFWDCEVEKFGDQGGFHIEIHPDTFFHLVPTASVPVSREDIFVLYPNTGGSSKSAVSRSREGTQFHCFQELFGNGIPFKIVLLRSQLRDKLEYRRVHNCWNLCFDSPTLDIQSSPID